MNILVLEEKQLGQCLKKIADSRGGIGELIYLDVRRKYFRQYVVREFV
jgi:hypothetical protein